jgi:glyoxalase family protein
MPSVLDALGSGLVAQENDRGRYRATDDRGGVLDTQLPFGREGGGTAHHVAFRVTDETQPEWREALIDAGLRPTEIIDRKWFRAVYARTPGGVLFEFATEEPGYTVDEDLEELGERLVLPAWLEDRRSGIEAGLPDLPV